MEKTNILARMLGRISCIPVLLVMVAFIGCSKSPEVVITTPPIPTPGNNTPSGDIETFIANDTLVPFNKGSKIKWLVVGTNNLTVVTYNGIKVAPYGSFETGPLKKTTQFTLAVNSGKQASVTIKAVDSITTLLWGNGKRLRQTKAEVYRLTAGQTASEWVDTTISARAADERIFFSLNGRSTIILSNAARNVSPPDGGMFVVNAALTGFTWQGIFFTIVSLTDTTLVVTYVVTQANDSKLIMRNTYEFE